MPAPTTHVLTGLAVLVGAASPARRLRWLHAVTASILALGPDLLLFAALALGVTGFAAERASHSLLVVGMVAIVLRLWLGKTAVDSPPSRRELSCLPTETTSRTVGLAAAIWLSHLLFDSLSADLADPPGIALLWPIWEKPVQLGAWFPVKVVETDNLEAIIDSLLSGPFLHHTAREALLVAPLLAVAWLWRRRLRSRISAS